MRAVATVLTVYGIETNLLDQHLHQKKKLKLQQYLPFTVLKLEFSSACFNTSKVATVLTVYGIETMLLG